MINLHGYFRYYNVANLLWCLNKEVGGKYVHLAMHNHLQVSDM